MIKNIKKINYLILSLFLVLLTIIGSLLTFSTTGKVKADTERNNGLSNVSLIGYYKVNNPTGVGYWYCVENDYYAPELFEYGVILFPYDYFSPDGLQEDCDYIVELRNKSLSFNHTIFNDSNSVSTKYGQCCFSGIVFNNETNKNRLMFVCFYLLDNATNTYYYSKNTSFTFTYNSMDENMFDDDELMYFKTEYSEMLIQYNELHSTLNNMQNQIDILTDENNNLSTENNELKKSNSELTTENSSLNNQNNTLIEENNELAAENDDLTIKNNKLDLENKDLIEKNKNLEDKIKALEKNTPTKTNNSTTVWLVIGGSLLLLVMIALPLLFPSKSKIKN